MASQAGGCRLAPLGATKTNELHKLPLSGDLDLFDPSRYKRC